MCVFHKKNENKAGAGGSPPLLLQKKKKKKETPAGESEMRGRKLKLLNVLRVHVGVFSSHSQYCSLLTQRSISDSTSPPLLNISPISSSIFHAVCLCMRSSVYLGLRTMTKVCWYTVPWYSAPLHSGRRNVFVFLLQL